VVAVRLRQLEFIEGKIQVEKALPISTLMD